MRGQADGVQGLWPFCDTVTSTGVAVLNRYDNTVSHAEDYPAGTTYGSPERSDARLRALNTALHFNEYSVGKTPIEIREYVANYQAS